MVSKRGKRGASTSADDANKKPPDAIPAPSPYQGLSPPQFSLLVCISLAFTHILDAFKTITSIREVLNVGIISPENSTQISLNATAYCARHFKNTTEIIADTKDEVIAELGCTLTDFSILNVKHQTTILRVVLCVLTSLLCWGNEPLLKSWSLAYGIFVFVTLGGLMAQYDILKGNERFSLVAMLVLQNFGTTLDHTQDNFETTLRQV